MAALNRLYASFKLCATLAWRARCAGRHYVRRHGWLPGLLLACAVVSGAAWWMDGYQADRLVALQRQAVSSESARTRAPAVRPVLPGTEARLQAFEQLLVPYGALADVVQEVLRLGAQEGLAMQRGEYREQVDAAGGFVRYHMTMPVKGSPQAVQRLIQQALHAERALGLASVQYRRERPDSQEMEATIEWIVHARVPANTSMPQASKGASP